MCVCVRVGVSVWWSANYNTSCWAQNLTIWTHVSARFARVRIRVRARARASPTFQCFLFYLQLQCQCAWPTRRTEKNKHFPWIFRACAMQNCNLIKLKSHTMRLIARSWPAAERGYWVKGFHSGSTDCEYPIMDNYLHNPNTKFSHAWLNFGYPLSMQFLISSPHGCWLGLLIGRSAGG